MQEEFWQALLQGKVCLHPTDSLPGLTFHPGQDAAFEVLRQWKGRPKDKPCIGLATSFKFAARFWQPLPSSWENVLQRIWPAPLSVIWRAADTCPDSLRALDGSVCMRIPRWPKDGIWLTEVIENLDLPLPTTSVNKSGTDSAKNWEEACNRLTDLGDGVYIPRLQSPPTFIGTPSTVIRIIDERCFEVLREGAYPVSELEQQGFKYE
jgi:L-threonylcarbamoyladenylate synthase